MSKIAIVTGGNKGIGFAIVKGLCQKFNGTVYLTARDVQRGENAVNELEKENLYPIFHQLNITDQASVDRFRDFIKEKHGGIDILVNNAGIGFSVESDVPIATQAEETIKVNYFSLIRVCNALFPLLRANARVVNLSSSFGHLSVIPEGEIRKRMGDPNLNEDQLSVLMREFVESAKNNRILEDGWVHDLQISSYKVSKIAVSALTFIQQKMFDLDSRSGIIVNAVHPGFVDTDMTNHTGVLSIEEGADAPLYLALLPTDTKIKGCYVWRDKQIVDWRAETMPLK